MDYMLAVSGAVGVMFLGLALGYYFGSRGDRRHGRLSMALHVLRGRPLVYRARLTGDHPEPVLTINRRHTWVVETEVSNHHEDGVGVLIPIHREGDPE